MKTTYYILFIYFLISCNTPKSEQQQQTDTVRAIVQKDTIQQPTDTVVDSDISETYKQTAKLDTILNSSRQIDTGIRLRLDSIISKKAVPITKLPFKSLKTAKDIYFRMPVVDTIIYYPLESGFDSNFKSRKDLLKLYTYTNRLPDLYMYQVYYTEFSCRFNDNVNQMEMCQNFGDITCGFIIFYDPKNQKAHMINIKNEYYIDSVTMMDFSIDTNYDIHINEDMATDGDDGNGAIVHGLGETVIHVSKDGKIMIDKK